LSHRCITPGYDLAPMRMRLAGTIATAVALACAGSAHGARLKFTAPAVLPDSPPASTGMPGAEPSLEFDPIDGRHVYVVAPGFSQSGPGGIDFWASANGGKTWPIHQNVGSAAGGGDADVEVGIDHTVYAADLEVASTAICRSHDYGRTFG